MTRQERNHKPSIPSMSNSTLQTGLTSGQRWLAQTLYRHVHSSRPLCQTAPQLHGWTQQRRAIHPPPPPHSTGLSESHRVPVTGSSGRQRQCHLHTTSLHQQLSTRSPSFCVCLSFSLPSSLCVPLSPMADWGTSLS